VRKGERGNWQGDRKQSTLWSIHSQIGWESARPDNEDKATGHSAQKPIECMKRPIENNSKPGDAVYEPFSGSGTTIIAAEMTGRKCHAIEIDPAYVDVAIIRWQNFTGQQAKLGDKTFAQMAKQRKKKAA
jgi:DNA modification methylase